MRNRALTFLILVACQVLICNYLHLSMYLSLSILPVLIICLPTKITTPVAMIIAFAAGFVVDYTAEGVLGLNSLACCADQCAMQFLVKSLSHERKIFPLPRLAGRRSHLLYRSHKPCSCLSTSGPTVARHARSASTCYAALSPLPWESSFPFRSPTS